MRHADIILDRVVDFGAGVGGIQRSSPSRKPAECRMKLAPHCSAASIETALRDNKDKVTGGANRLGQDTSGFRFTSAEFALEMIKGVSKVEFQFSATSV